MTASPKSAILLPMDDVTFLPAGGSQGVHFGAEALAAVTRLATQRRDNARKSQRVQTRNIAGTAEDSIETEVQSLLAEYAVALYLGQNDWAPVIGRPDREEGDVTVKGIPIEVKSTVRVDGSLIVPDEAPNRPYVLTVVKGSLVKIVGWQMAHNCHKPEFWRSDVRHPNFFVPQNRLYPMDALKKVLDER